MDIKTYPEMNEKIKDILMVSGLPAHIYAAKRIEELEREREEHLRLILQVNTEIDEFMSLLEISFESHPSVTHKAKAFNATIRRYREALEKIDTHIRSTSDPVPYIIQTLKSTLPEYKDWRDIGE